MWDEPTKGEVCVTCNDSELLGLRRAGCEHGISGLFEFARLRGDGCGTSSPGDLDTRVVWTDK